MPRRNDNSLFWLIAIGLLVWWLSQQPTPGTPSSPEVKVTEVHLIYEKDDSAIPSAVAGAITKLNRLGIDANMWDDDVVDGTGEIPDNHKVPLDEAKKVGLPALVVMAGDKVHKVVKDPKTEESVLDAVK